jgi:molybdopterin-guanine dinucleotide biosynthesis protein A
VSRPSGILLAGGASRRFGRPKILEPLDGSPLFHHPLRALAAVCDEVLVVIAPDSPELALPDGVAGVRFVRDAVSHGGPFLGTVTGLARAQGEQAVLAAADQPRLRPELLSLMVTRAGASARSATVLADDDGPRPLPAVLRVKPALSLAESLVRVGERRLRALIDGLEPDVVDEMAWAAVDPAGDWRRDVDVPEDLPRH